MGLLVQPGGVGQGPLPQQDVLLREHSLDRTLKSKADINATLYINDSNDRTYRQQAFKKPSNSCLVLLINTKFMDERKFYIMRMLYSRSRKHLIKIQENSVTL